MILIMKQAILVRMDLKMDKGKLATQCCHASVETVLKSGNYMVNAWRAEGMKKIVLKVADKKELLELKKKAGSFNLVTDLITDAGLTFFKKPTVTCLAIGPDEDEKIDNVTKDLKLL